MLLSSSFWNGTEGLAAAEGDLSTRSAQGCIPSELLACLVFGEFASLVLASVYFVVRSCRLVCGSASVAASPSAFVSGAAADSEVLQRIPGRRLAHVADVRAIMCPMSAGAGCRCWGSAFPDSGFPWPPIAFAGHLWEPRRSNGLYAAQARPQLRSGHERVAGYIARAEFFLHRRVHFNDRDASTTKPKHRNCCCAAAQTLNRVSLG